jgi:hypothetical protein
MDLLEHVPQVFVVGVAGRVGGLRDQVRPAHWISLSGRAPIEVRPEEQAMTERQALEIARLMVAAMAEIAAAPPGEERAMMKQQAIEVARLMIAGMRDTPAAADVLAQMVEFATRRKELGHEEPVTPDRLREQLGSLGCNAWWRRFDGEGGFHFPGRN